jgi:hypothetical protein
MSLAIVSQMTAFPNIYNEAYIFNDDLAPRLVHQTAVTQINGLQMTENADEILIKYCRC